jgi:predicted Zn-dependent protease
MTFTPERGFKLAVLAACLAAALAGTSLAAASSEVAGFLASAQAALRQGDGIAAEADLRRALDAGAARADVAAAMGDALLQQGADDQAREWLAPGQFAGGQESYGWRMLGRLERNGGNLPAAGRAYDRALQFAPNDGELWVDIGRLRYAGGEQLQAVEAADRALALAPVSPRALEFRGELIRDQYGLAAALPGFAAGLKQRPDDLALLGEYAATLGELGRAKEMLKATRHMLALDPGNARALYLQAVLAARAGKMDLARALLGRIGDRMAGVPAAMLLRGALELEAGNPNLAIDVLDRLVRMQPANRPARLLLARAAAVAGDRGQLFSAYPDDTAGSPYLLTLQARAQEDQGRRDLAAALLSRAAAAGGEPSPIGERQDARVLAADWAESPGRIGAGVPYVRKLVAAGNLALAAEIAEKLRQSNPGSADAQALAGDVQLLRHDPAGAIERYRIAAKVRMTSDLVGRMALALDRAGQPAAADQLVEAQLAASPTERRLNRLAARRAAQRGDWRRARALLEYLAPAAPRDPALLDELSLARLRLGDKAAAEQAAAEAYALRRGSAAAARSYAEAASGALAVLLNAKAERFDEGQPPG